MLILIYNCYRVTVNASERYVSSLHGYVYHMEVDLYKKNDSLLFSDTEIIKTTNGANVWSIWNGTEAMFGFKQINATHVVMAHLREHCLRILNRATNRAIPLAGKCGFSGGNDGIGTSARFSGHYGVELNKRQPEQVLVADYIKSTLRSIEIENGRVSTVVNTGLNNPQQMVWYQKTLLITNTRHIAQVRWSDEGFPEVSTLTNSLTKHGLVDGDFASARFDHPEEIIKLSEYFFLVAEAVYGYKCLRLLDMVQNCVLPVCIKTVCNVSTPIPTRPYSLLKYKEDIYVGTRQAIIKLSGELENIPVMKIIYF